MNCANCKIETTNPKFCSRSCAASHNNRLIPKRRPESICAMCGGACTTKRTYCSDCWQIKSQEKSIMRWESCTLGEMKGSGNANYKSRYPYIRTMARQKYIKSGRSMACNSCGYTLHVDVCHIKEIRSFSLDSLISEINDLSNLTALCKTHHWELDHGLLKSVALSTELRGQGITEKRNG